MSFLQTASFLRGALVLDAAISGTTGVVMLLGAGALESLLSVPATLLRYAGVSLLPFAAALVYLSTRQKVPPTSVRTVIAANLAWVVASVGLLLSGRIEPNAWGVAVILLQAIAVAAFADVQYIALRRSTVSQSG
jgi:4-amino-4-deoxy-L-arabinose transferase-like glycosyltransferase